MINQTRAAIVVHGGAATPNEGSYRDGVIGAAVVGMDVLRHGGMAVDAVEAAVKCMEDDPVFDAGTGSYLNLNGDVEMDASIMCGLSLKAGGVGAIGKVAHPISVARKVMEETDHLLLVGSSATEFALAVGFPSVDLKTEHALQDWREARKAFESDGPMEGITSYWARMRELARKYPGLYHTGSTVGAVAIDLEGHVASATSTGGITLKLPGRVGDSAIIGCGTYADDLAGAVSATGHGENIVRFVAAKQCADFMREGMTAQEAAEETIRRITRRCATRIGLIAIDRHGGVGVARNVRTMARATYRLCMAQPDADYGVVVGQALDV